jgi:hypothetical protein
MRRRSALAALAAALALAPAVPAFAADPTPAPSGDPLLTAKVDAAIANATSYRIAVAGPSLALDIREFGPDRVKISSTNGATSSESIVVGTSMYYRSGGGAWKAYPVPPVPRMRRNRLYMGAPDTLLEPLADRADGAETLGAFRAVAVGNGQLPGTMDCTYDKVTYRPRACSVLVRGLGSPLQVSYAGWDDPANAVEPPAGVAPPPPPQPSASPGPRAPN